MKSKLLFAIAAATLPLGGGLSVSANPAPPFVLWFLSNPLQRTGKNLPLMTVNLRF
uniref:Uncharacterized protein n=1 Tax=Desertifilum tharense IPPAS B-1220 TaxID=1781255 RepID=A0ACD5H1M2_9CYAN